MRAGENKESSSHIRGRQVMPTWHPHHTTAWNLDIVHFSLPHSSRYQNDHVVHENVSHWHYYENNVAPGHIEQIMRQLVLYSHHRSVYFSCYDSH